jgi:hypothetical protein
MEASLALFLNELKQFRRALKSDNLLRVSKRTHCDKAKELGSRWHKEYGPKLRSALPSEVRERYDSAFTRLLKLSAPNNLRSSYINALNDLIKPFNDELLIPARQGEIADTPASAFDSFFASIRDSDESEYLQEAIACARAQHFRAAAVLGWSAAINRVHRKIGEIGFEKFNETSARMALQQTGRYKKFTQVQRVSNMSEIREVFDNVILWVIEGMELIDSNQHTRLRSCFEIRCQSAHPGDAPITSFNLLSFFSDLDQIVLSNGKFQITTALPA